MSTPFSLPIPAPQLSELGKYDKRVKDAADAGNVPSLSVEDARAALGKLREAFVLSKETNKLAGKQIPPALEKYATDVFNALAKVTPEDDGNINKTPGRR